MIKRYLAVLGGSGVTYIASNVLASSTISTATFTIIVNGAPNSVVTFKVTTYSASDPGSAVLTINTVTYVLNNTFNITLDNFGTTTITEVLNVGSMTTGHGIQVIVTIESASLGVVSPTLNTFSNEKIV